MSWRRFFSRAERDRERAQEIETHLALYIDELVARGRTEDAATREARLVFGNARAKREEIDAMNRLPVLDVLGRDLRFAVRVLRRTPAFTVTAIATLALAIGANTAVFSLAHAILLRPLPYPHPERLATLVVETHSTRGANTEDSHDGTTWELIRDFAPAIDAAVTASGLGNEVNLVVGNTATSVSQARVGAGYFRVLGVAPFIGREFTPDEDRPGGPAVAILSYGLWQRVLHGDASPVGQMILLRGERYEVVGVMPQTFQNPGETADVWTPVRPSRTGEGSGTNYGVIVRVKDGHTWSEALASMPAPDSEYFKRINGKDDAKNPATANFSLIPLQQSLVADVRQPILMLAGAVGLVLLIACVNLATLLLARGGSRTKEIATRMALGSGRTAVIRQLLVESVVLSLVGGALGLFVGFVGLESLKAIGGDTFDAWTRVTLDAPTIGATVGLSLVTSLVFGLVPALQSSRLDVNAALSEGGSRGVAGGSRHWTRRFLVSAEVALGVVLLVVTGLLIRTFVNLRHVDPGFDPSGVVTASVSLQDARYKTAAKMNQLFDGTLRQLAQTPGIESAAVSLELPYRRLLNMGFRFLDRPPDDPNPTIANVMYVTPDFFKTLRIPLRGGRAIADTDVASAPPVVVVNEGFVRLSSEGKDPTGRRIRVAGAEREIVGVVGNVQVTSSGFFLTGMVRGPLTVGPLIFLPAAQTSNGFMGMHIWFSPMWSVRASSTVVGEAALQRAIGEADPLLPVGSVRRMADVQAAATSQQRLLMLLVGVLTAAAVLLAAIGIHGLIAHSVQERTRELGIRMALGATTGQTICRIALSGMALSLSGALVGGGLSILAVRLVESFLWNVSVHDPITYVGVVAFLSVVSGVASVLPALRILRLDPAATLRT